MVRCKRDEKMVVWPPYAITYLMAGSDFFVSTLASEIDGIRGQKWNAERV